MKIDINKLEEASQKELIKKKKHKAINFSLKRFTDKQKIDFYREFSTLIKSGIDYNHALHILSTQQKSKYLKTVYLQIKTSVVKGKTLNESIKQHEKLFSSYEYYSVKIGEETKRLPQIFDQLQLFYQRKVKMKRQIFSVLAYPVFVLLITLAVLYFMLNYVVPMFSTIFMQFGKELPKITQFIVKASQNFNIYFGTLIAIILVLIISNKLLKNNEKYQTYKSLLLLKTPYFGPLIKKIYLARFCQSLSLLLSARTSLITALELTEKMIDFHPLKRSLQQAKIDILKGETLTNSLEKHSFFSAKVVSLTQIGEQINELDKMYNDLADQYNEDIEHSTKIIGTILEPLMIVFVGSIVGFIMIAMYSPIFNLSKVIEN
jgi:type IV pilus assembly protein PilC